MGRFKKDVQKWAKDALEEVEDIRKQVILSLFFAVVRDSPVDTGRLRGNWLISSGQPNTGEIEVKDPSGQTTIQNIKSFVEKSKLGKDSVTFLTNNLPYAYRVEYGGYNGPSQKVRADGFLVQSPKGMVRKNAVRISNNLKRKYR